MLVASATVLFYVVRPTVRFTNATDTVLGIGVEATTVAEEAIEKGRCVEFYVTDGDERENAQSQDSQCLPHSSQSWLVPGTVDCKGKTQALVLTRGCVCGENFHVLSMGIPFCCFNA